MAIEWDSEVKILWVDFRLLHIGCVVESLFRADEIVQYALVLCLNDGKDKALRDLQCSILCGMESDGQIS